MTVTHVGTTKKYASGWEAVFAKGAKKKAAAAAKKPAAKSTKKRGKK